MIPGLSILCLVTSLNAADPLALNFHLMHPGGDSRPGDPNAAFHLDGTYHLHYIMSYPWTVKGKPRKGFSFVHVTSPDMLHWTWQRTKLQPSFTGHGIYSGTGFLTKEGKPAAIYHGAGSRRNQIAIAKDRQLSDWEKFFPVEPKTPDGKQANIKHWDPDCFLIGDNYTFVVQRASESRVDFEGEGGEFRINLFQALPNQTHVLELISVGNQKVAIRFFDVFEPPLR
ncbi:MAG: hypothetical protein ACKVHO_11485 [Verrucomicrobiia bacterium]|jgi:sucrose-6-phosphate hydrolase SacC (GH32 family)